MQPDEGSDVSKRLKITFLDFPSPKKTTFLKYSKNRRPSEATKTTRYSAGTHFAF
jgi:hypothetical protein